MNVLDHIQDKAEKYCCLNRHEHTIKTGYITLFKILTSVIESIAQKIYLNVGNCVFIN